MRYLIVGGEAVIFHGHARLTGDVDFFFSPDSENAKRLFAALSDFWGGDVPEVKSAEELMVQGLILQYGLPPNRIDLINQVDGVTFDEAWIPRVKATLITSSNEVPLYYIGVDELIRNKENAARSKDLDDLEYLRRTKEG